MLGSVCMQRWGDFSRQRQHVQRPYVKGLSKEHSGGQCERKGKVVGEGTTLFRSSQTRQDLICLLPHTATSCVPHTRRKSVVSSPALLWPTFTISLLVSVTDSFLKKICKWFFLKPQTFILIINRRHARWKKYKQSIDVKGKCSPKSYPPKTITVNNSTYSFRPL